MNKALEAKLNCVDDVVPKRGSFFSELLPGALLLILIHVVGIDRRWKVIADGYQL